MPAEIKASVLKLHPSGERTFGPDEFVVDVTVSHPKKKKPNDPQPGRHIDSRATSEMKNAPETRSAY